MPERFREPLPPDISGENTIQINLFDIANHELLDPSEEIELGRLIRTGIDAEEQLVNETDPDLIRELEEIVAAGYEARKVLTRMNGRLVVAVAKKWTGNGVPFIDLMQEGYIGLMKAVVKYDYRKGYKFSTYANPWIKQAIQRAIMNQKSTIRLPVHVHHTFWQIKKVREDLEFQYDTVTDEMIAEELGIPVEKVRYTVEKYRRQQSLDKELSDDTDRTFGEIMSDDEATTTIEHLEEVALAEDVHMALSELDYKARSIIIMRYGLDGNVPMTLKEVGQEFGVTRERIRQIEKEALRVIKRSKYVYALKEYLT